MHCLASKACEKKSLFVFLNNGLQSCRPYIPRSIPKSKTYNDLLGGLNYWSISFILT